MAKGLGHGDWATSIGPRVFGLLGASSDTHLSQHVLPPSKAGFWSRGRGSPAALAQVGPLTGAARRPRGDRSAQPIGIEGDRTRIQFRISECPGRCWVFDRQCRQSRRKGRWVMSVVGRVWTEPEKDKGKDGKEHACLVMIDEAEKGWSTTPISAPTSRGMARTSAAMPASHFRRRAPWRPPQNRRNPGSCRSEDCQ